MAAHRAINAPSCARWLIAFGLDPPNHHAILYINRSGNAWRMSPRDFGPWSSVYHYLRLFRDDGTWQRIHDELRTKIRRSFDKKPTPSTAILDSQSVKTDALSKTNATGTTRARRALVASAL